MYKIGEAYDIETESKFGSDRIVQVTAVGGAIIKIPPFGSVTAGRAPAKSYGKEFPVPTLHGDRSIIRQNSLKHAGDLWSHLQPILSENKVPTKKDMEKAAKAIIELARQFEEYSAGDVERRVAEETAANSAKAAAA